ncbi:MAG: hypothetical protein V7K42_22615 [Nostoc sp.]
MELLKTLREHFVRNDNYLTGHDMSYSSAKLPEEEPISKSFPQAWATVTQVKSL